MRVVSFRNLARCLAVVVAVVYVLKGTLFATSSTVSAAESRREVALAWSTLRGLVPRGVPLYRPGWLPAPLQRARVGCDYASAGGSGGVEVLYGDVGYADGSGDGVAMVIQDLRHDPAPEMTSGFAPDWSMAIGVGKFSGYLQVEHGTSLLGYTWQTGTWRYSVQSKGVELVDLLRIVDQLRTA
jgi:hypothetical protein